MQVFGLVVLAAASGSSSQAGMRSTMDMSAYMEAQAQAQMLAQHTGRLGEFGMNLPNVEEVHKAETSAETLFKYLHFVSFAFLLKSGAIVSSFMGQMSPLPVVLGMKEAKSTMQYPPFTFFCVFACGLQWCVYGTFAFVVTRNYGFLILVYANACGVVMGAYYVFQYYMNCQCPTRQRQLTNCAYAAVLNGIFQSLVIADLAHTRALLTVGTISAGLSVMVTAAPLAELPMMLKTRDVSSLPREFVCCQFVCSALWFGCGVLLHDTWILIPNVFGLVLGAFQVFLLYAYGDLMGGMAKAQTPVGKSLLPSGKGSLPPAYGALAVDEAAHTVRCGTGGTD